MQKTSKMESPTMEMDLKDVTLEITRKCPLNCIFCSSNGGEPHKNELSIIEWKKIIDEAQDLGANSLLVSGGEPFTSPYLEELCEYINTKLMDLSIYTSGNVYNKNRITSLKVSDLNFITKLKTTRIVISLEGSNEFIHDELTGIKGSFINAIKSIKTIKKLNIPLETHLVPTKKNYKDIKNVVLLAHELGVNKISILRFVPQGRGAINRDILELNKGELIELKEILSSLENKNDFIRIGSPFNPFLLSKNYRCTAGQNRITIKYDGLAIPCEAFKFMANYYNEEIDVRKNSLLEIMINSSLFKNVRKIRENNIIDLCNTCEFIDNCHGGCPAQKLLKNNIYNDPICLKSCINMEIGDKI